MLVIIDYDFILWVLRIGHRSISPFPQAQQDLLSNLVHVSIHGVKFTSWRQTCDFCWYHNQYYKKRLDDIVIDLINNEWPDYELTNKISSEIPEARRAEKNCKEVLLSLY